MKRIMVSNFGYKRDQASGFPWVLLNLLIMVMAGQKVMTRTWKSYSRYQKIWLWCGRVQKFERKNHKCCPLKIAKLMVELLDPWNDPHLIRCTSRILPRRRRRRRKERGQKYVTLQLLLLTQVKQVRRQLVLELPGLVSIPIFSPLCNDANLTKSKNYHTWQLN